MVAAMHGPVHGRPNRLTSDCSLQAVARVILCTCFNLAAGLGGLGASVERAMVCESCWEIAPECHVKQPAAPMLLHTAGFVSLLSSLMISQWQWPHLRVKFLHETPQSRGRWVIACVSTVHQSIAKLTAVRSFPPECGSRAARQRHN